MVVETKFDIGDRVIIDGDVEIKAVVISIDIRPGGFIRYELSWFIGGDPKFVVFDEWRLTKA